jgi:hypothetical protein
VSPLTSTEWSVRKIARYSVVLLGGIIAGGRAVSAVQLWQQYHSASRQDPAAADAYLSSIVTDLIIVALSVAVAGLVWWLTRATSGNSATRRD